MLDEASATEVTQSSRTCTIVVAALCMGVITFGAVVVLVLQPQEPGDDYLMSLVAAAMLTGFAIAGWTVPSLVVTAQRRKIASGQFISNRPGYPVPETDAGKLAAVYQMKTIIRGALWEAPSFMALIAYIVEGQIYVLIVAAIGLIGLLTLIPTPGRVTEWVEGQLELMRLEKGF